MYRWNNATGREIGQSSSSSQETAQRVFVALRRGDLIADPHNDSRDYYNGGYGGDGSSGGGYGWGSAAGSGGGGSGGGGSGGGGSGGDGSGCGVCVCHVSLSSHYDSRSVDVAAVACLAGLTTIYTTIVT